ncbi:MAG: molecular chaperone HtpG, partial [Oceanococcaceae bacterium]
RAGSEEAWCWESEGTGSYTLEPCEKAGRGTEIRLNIREGEDEFLERYRLQHIIKTYSDHISLPVRLQKDKSEEDEG